MLVRFHFLLIIAAMVFCFGFSLYQLFWPTSSRGATVSIVSAAAGGLLGLYLLSIWRRGVRP